MYRTYTHVYIYIYIHTHTYIHTYTTHTQVVGPEVKMVPKERIYELKDGIKEVENDIGILKGNQGVFVYIYIYIYIYIYMYM